MNISSLTINRRCVPLVAIAIVLTSIILNIEMSTICNGSATYCSNGCCHNSKLYCCNRTCSGEFCQTDTVESLILEIIGDIIGVGFALMIVAIMVCTFKKLRSSSGFSSSSGTNRWDCSRSCLTCSWICDRDCRCNCYHCDSTSIDSDKCLSYVSCVFLSPCLFVVWLRQEWRKRVNGSENDQTTHGVQYNTQENPDTSYTERQISDNPHQRPSEPPDFHYSEQGAAAPLPTGQLEEPPSYDEAMKQGPPTYNESHQYLKEKV